MGYLTSKQKLIWDLKRKGFSEASIARKLDVARQTIHKAVSVCKSKVYIALKEAAKLNKIDVETIDPAKGILIVTVQSSKLRRLSPFQPPMEFRSGIGMREIAKIVNSFKSAEKCCWLRQKTGIFNFQKMQIRCCHQNWLKLCSQRS